MLSEQDKCEIRKSYRNAIDPRQQVKILMQLYLVSREEILDDTGAACQGTTPPKTEHGRAGPSAYVCIRSSSNVSCGLCWRDDLEEAGAMMTSDRHRGPGRRMCRRWPPGPIMYEGRKKTNAKL